MAKVTLQRYVNLNKLYSAKDNMTEIEYMPSPQMPLYQVGIHQSQYASKQAKATVTNDTIFVWAPVHELVSSILPFFNHIPLC